MKIRKSKFCKCNHPIDEKGRRVFSVGAYVEDGVWYCGRCKKIIPMTENEKYLAREESYEESID